MRVDGDRARATTTRGTSATSTSRRCSATAAPCSTSERVSVVACDSTEPDLDHGEIGRGRYPWIEEQFSPPATLRIFVLHHHLLPVPGTGRERNVVYDAGDAIECLLRAGVDLVLCGHKHVPYAWRLEDMFIVNTGTVSSLRLRGNTRPCYNVVARRRPGGGGVAPVPLPRARSDHSLLDRDAGLREARRHDRFGDHAADMRAIAIIDGEHYARRRAAGARRASVRVRRRRARRAARRSCAGARAYGVPLAPGLEEAVAEHVPEIVVDLSDEPVLGPVERFRLASRVLALGAALRRRRLPARPARLRARRGAVDRGRQERASGSARRRSRASWPGLPPRSTTWSSSRWDAAGRPSRRSSSRRPSVDELVERAPGRRARGVRLPGDGGRAPASSRSAAGAAAAASPARPGCRTARGPGTCRGAAAGAPRSATAAAPRSRRSTPMRACSSPRRCRALT